MAHIVDDGTIIKNGDGGTVLDKVTFDRQWDMLRLARRGDRQAVRIWNDFAASNPAMARLVTKYDAVERSEAEDARREVDAVLTKVEKSTRKPKAAKVAKRAAAVAVSREAAIRAAIVADLGSPDPGVREVARDILRRGLA